MLFSSLELLDIQDRLKIAEFELENVRRKIWKTQTYTEEEIKKERLKQMIRRKREIEGERIREYIKMERGEGEFIKGVYKRRCNIIERREEEIEEFREIKKELIRQRRRSELIYNQIKYTLESLIKIRKIAITKLKHSFRFIVEEEKKIMIMRIEEAIRSRKRMEEEYRGYKKGVEKEGIEEEVEYRMKRDEVEGIKKRYEEIKGNIEERERRIRLI
jgi:hypothetical protein